MIRKWLAIFLFLVLSVNALAQDDLDSMVDYKVNKMQKTLNLTYDQANTLRPIIKDYTSKRTAFLQETAGEGIVDHVAVKTTLKTLKETEYRKLSKILTPEQMKKWIDKENLMAALNPDSGESAEDDGDSTLTMQGASLKF